MMENQENVSRETIKTRSELIQNGKEIKLLKEAIADIDEAIRKKWECLHGDYLYRKNKWKYTMELKKAQKLREQYYQTKKQSK